MPTTVLVDGDGDGDGYGDGDGDFHWIAYSGDFAGRIIIDFMIIVTVAIDPVVVCGWGMME